MLIAPLAAGPLDIIGDVHGEVDALRALLVKLGYDEDGAHPDGRHLVFLGDLTDRGPDSPAVVELVMHLVQAGRAQCIAGNHELNLLRDVAKHGNDWWSQPEVESELPSVPVTPAQKARFLEFLLTLPIALERDDLRVVHACWHEPSIDVLRARTEEPDTNALTLYHEYVDAFRKTWGSPEQRAALKAEREGIDLHDGDVRPPLLPRLAEFDRDHQGANVVTALTSGLEAPVGEPFWAGGRWRMVQRVKWWEQYADEVPVVVGHYWRRYNDIPPSYADKYGPDLFEGIPPHHWMGQGRNVYCVDFSVGGRSAQRHIGEPEHLCQLAALRVPEWQVVHDAGETWEIGPPGS